MDPEAEDFVFWASDEDNEEDAKEAAVVSENDGINLKSLQILLGHGAVTSSEQVSVVHKMLLCVKNHHPTKSHLVFDRNKLPFFCREHHHQALKKLIQLHDNSSSLVCFSCHDQHFGSLGALFVACCLKNNTCLKSLTLNGCGISAKAASFLFSALETNTTLEHVNLLDNMMAVAPDKIQCLVALCSVMRTNQTLKSLKVDFSPMGPDLISHIADALGENKSLTCFWMKGGLQDSNHTTLFRRTMKSNTTLSELLFVLVINPSEDAVLCSHVDKEVLMGLALNRIRVHEMLKASSKGEFGVWPHLLAKIGQANTRLRQSWVGWQKDVMFWLLKKMPSLFHHAVNQKKRKRTVSDGGPAATGNACSQNDDFFAGSISCHMPKKEEDEAKWFDDVERLHFMDSNVNEQIGAERVRFAEAWLVVHGKFVRRWGQHRVPREIRKAKQLHSQWFCSSCLMQFQSASNTK